MLNIKSDVNTVFFHLSVDLDKKTVTLTVKNKDLAQGASDFANELKKDYSAFQLLAKLSDDTFLDSRLAQLKEKIADAQMEENSKKKIRKAAGQAGSYGL